MTMIEIVLLIVLAAMVAMQFQIIWLERRMTKLELDIFRAEALEETADEPQRHDYRGA